VSVRICGMFVFAGCRGKFESCKKLSGRLLAVHSTFHNVTTPFTVKAKLDDFHLGTTDARNKSDKLSLSVQYLFPSCQKSSGHDSVRTRGVIRSRPH
jgi:hypothetical protein